MNRIDNVLERVTEIPFSPAAEKVLQVAQDERAGARELARVIAQDPAFTARLLRIANSPYYGLSRKVMTVSQAVAVLGTNTITSLALALFAFCSLPQEENDALSIGQLWEHSLGCALWGRQIATRVSHASPEEAFIACLLHDMGKALFYRYFRKEFLEAVRLAEGDGISLLEAERRILGTDHAAAGEVLARKWNLPPALQHSIGLHPSPLSMPETVDLAVRKIVAIVHVADIFCESFQLGNGGDGGCRTIDEEVWALLGVGEKECRELLGPVVDEMEKEREIFDFAAGRKSPTKENKDVSNLRSVERSPPPLAKEQPAAERSPEEWMANFSRFVEAGKEIALLAGLEDLFPNITSQAMALVQADAAELLVPEGESLKVVASAGPCELMGRAIPAEGSLVGWVARMGEAVLVHNIVEASSCWEKEFFGPAGYRSHLVVPVEWAGKRIAVLSIHGRGERQWTPQEVGLFKVFVGLVAVALENSRLYSEVGEKVVDLQKLNRELEEALDLKTRFLSIVSHELRTPLIVIMGYSELITQSAFGMPDTGMQEGLEKIMKEANHLLTMITNLVDLSQMEGGTPAVHPEPVDLTALLSEVSAQTTALLAGKPVTLCCDHDRSLSTIFTDRQRLKQILLHLLDNAVKFTPGGKIVLRAATAQGGVEFSVQDTGIGVEAKNQEIIFDRFRQADDSNTRSYGGLGIGLHIVQRLLELLGGKITVESRAGEGSTFRVWIPGGEYPQAQKLSSNEGIQKRQQISGLGFASSGSPDP